MPLVKCSIDLDCAPGGIRPGDLIASVLKDTGLEAGDPVSKFFGNWRWEIQYDEEKWDKEIRPVIRPRIEALYHSGAIRYGSW